MCGACYVSLLCQAEARLSLVLPPAPVDYLARITAIYQKYNPDKLSDVNALMAKYKGQEKDLFYRIEKKYNVPPEQPQTSSLNSHEEVCNYDYRDNTNNNKTLQELNKHSSSAGLSLAPSKTNMSSSNTAGNVFLISNCIFVVCSLLSYFGV